MTEKQFYPIPATPVAPAKDWRSEREKAGWCRCGKREEVQSPGCEWHAARRGR